MVIKKIFWLVNLVIVNCFVIFNKIQVSKGFLTIKQKEFRLNLFHQLIESLTLRPVVKRGRHKLLSREDRLKNEQHFIGKREKGKHKDCAVCSKRTPTGKRKQTIYYCTTCPNQPSLCLQVCFKRYHIMENYKSKYK